VALKRVDLDRVARHPLVAVVLLVIACEVTIPVNLPRTGPGMADLVVGLVLRSTEVEQKTTVGDLALVVVGDRGSGAAAVRASLNGIVDRADGEERLECEIDTSRGGRRD
jgi:hypothetical protein